jgi:glycine cleavage system H protein
VSGTGGETILYKRERFITRLPIERRYTAAHYWLLEEANGIWRVGFTKFATRMLGDLVEYDFCVNPGMPVTVGQEIGSIEGFKAMSSLFSTVEGEFLGAGSDLAADITLAESDPYGRGWLYRVKGRPDPASTDVHGYIAILDTTIDRLLAARYAGEKAPDGDDQR